MNDAYLINEDKHIRTGCKPLRRANDVLAPAIDNLVLRYKSRKCLKANTCCINCKGYSLMGSITLGLLVSCDYMLMARCLDLSNSSD